MSYYSRWSYFSNFVEGSGNTFSVTSADSTMGQVNILTAPTCQSPTAVFNAVPNAGYSFAYWDDGNTDNPRTLTLLSDTAIVGYFTLVTYDTIYVHDTTVVTDTVTLTEYVQVHDTTYLTEYEYIHDTTYITLTDTMTITQYDTVDNYIHDTTLVTDTLYLFDTIYIYDTVYVHDTVYVPQEGIGEVETAHIKLYQRDGCIVVEGAEGLPVRVYDAVGRLVAVKGEEEEGRVSHAVPSTGVYLVRVGSLPARRVVVVR